MQCRCLSPGVNLLPPDLSSLLFSRPEKMRSAEMPTDEGPSLANDVFFKSCFVTMASNDDGDCWCRIGVRKQCPCEDSIDSNSRKETVWCLALIKEFIVGGFICLSKRQADMNIIELSNTKGVHASLRMACRCQVHINLTQPNLIHTLVPSKQMDASNIHSLTPWHVTEIIKRLTSLRVE